MGQYHVEIFQTLAVVLLLVIVKLLLRALVINLLGKLHLAPERRRIITKINNTPQSV